MTQTVPRPALRTDDFDTEKQVILEEIGMYDDRPEWREVSAKAPATLVLTQRATPFIYQGDELGMTNHASGSIEEYDDVEVKGLWRTLVETGRVPADELLAELAKTSRDHARTPMQWSEEAHGGFTTGTPWLVVNPNHTEINAVAQRADPDSVFHHHRRLIALRKEHPVLVHGAYRDLDPAHEQVFAYTRTLGSEAVVVVINMSTGPVEFELPDGMEVGASMLASGGAAPKPGGSVVSLAGWQAVIARTV